MSRCLQRTTLRLFQQAQMIEADGVIWPFPQETVYFVGGILKVSNVCKGPGQNQVSLVQISTSQCFPAVSDCFIGITRIQPDFGQGKVSSKKSRVPLDRIQKLGFCLPEVASLDI